MNWQAFGYGAAAGIGYQLLRYGVHGIVELVADSIVGWPPASPPTVTMRTIAVKRKRKIMDSETESSESDSDTKSPPKKKARIFPQNDIVITKFPDQKSRERKSRSSKSTEDRSSPFLLPTHPAFYGGTWESHKKHLEDKALKQTDHPVIKLDGPEDS
jgi:hypothetical protein